ncbi:MliC family protein [Devosia sp.]|uniref:MliC family protein n=1 Tax=Devosia sp. TaxID=1871048 RepID=UPI001B176858|nr:MliC family protein [Devosia sp.]MBO9587462.1 MliC family protein [Devosia sp.]
MIDLRSLIAGGVLVLAAGAALAQEAPAPAETAPTAPAAPTVTATLTLSLEATSDIERRTVIYQCDDGTGFRTQYVNAAPNFLAILPVEGDTYIFVTTVSGSGARYVSGPYEWWTKGDEATLRDLQAAEDAPPLATCLAAANTP